jgi:eukaryotic-like serine/threonine-protein kinase
LSTTTQVTVPRVVGKQLSVAQPALLHAGLKVRINYHHSHRHAGVVLGESPAGGSQADPGSTVTLTVSRGRGTVTVPQVRGFTVAAAEAAIHKAGLQVGKVQSVNDSQFPPGEVSSTSPFGGQPEPRGTRINLFVSAGPAKKTVPNVTGETESSAESTLKGLGFTVQPVFTISKQTPGTVISQTPPGNTQAAPGSVVTIDIAKAPPPPPSTATVPNVTGDTVAAARSALKAAGFTAVVSQQTVSNKAQDGIVLSQSPAGNSSAKKGSTVTIVVGHYKKQTHTTPTTSTNPPPPLIPGP